MSPPFELLERIPQALHPLDRPPPGPGWNHAELADLLPAGLPLRQAAVLVALVERPGGPQVLLTRRTDTLRQHGVDLFLDVVQLLGGVDPDAMQVTGVVGGQVGNIDPDVFAHGFRSFVFRVLRLRCA